MIEIKIDKEIMRRIRYDVEVSGMTLCRKMSAFIRDLSSVNDPNKEPDPDLVRKVKNMTMN